MEIVNSAERFFKVRRDPSRNNEGRRVRELIEHLKSQGGQRTLVRLEIRTDTEIERTWLLGDPLRDAFRRERDRELTNLDLSVPFAPYVDRLILEAARRHQAESGPGHRVRLLTADQGLARMALAEGMSPLHFRRVEAEDFFGRRLTGQTFDPFTGQIRRTPLLAVLWEIATAFGSARLEGENGHSFIVSALGEGPPWSPYHSVDDLLWCRFEASDACIKPSSRSSRQSRDGLSRPSGTPEASDPVGPQEDESPAGRSDRPRSSQETASKISGEGARRARNLAFQRFYVGRLLRLICVLDDEQEMDQRQVMEFLGTRHPRDRDEYRRFLSSANLVSVTDGVWRAEPATGPVSAALRNGRIGELREALAAAPSFSTFSARIERSAIGRVVDLSDLGRGAATYRTLGEITLLCAMVRGEGVYPTPAAPDVATFGRAALERFSALDRGDGLIPVGAWLESLIREDGIHPEHARRLLDEASAKGVLRRSTEGSTTQTRFDGHVVHVLRTDSGLPVVTPVHLYRGDYLIPGKASVSLRIEDPKP